jgi:alpha-L-arabinofuranosidase
VTVPSPETVLAIGGRDEKSGDVILKILNTTGGAVETKVRLDGAIHLAPEGELTVLTSRSIEDENSFEEPRKIAPVSRAVKTGESSILSLAPYSLNVLRLHTKDNTQ